MQWRYCIYIWVGFLNQLVTKGAHFVCVYIYMHIYSVFLYHLSMYPRSFSLTCRAGWPEANVVGLRENLQETMVFTIEYRAFRFQFSHHPILWKMDRFEHYVEFSFIFLNFPHLKMCTYMHRCVHTWIILNVYLVLYIYDLLSYR